jgi:hypothetical protein
MESLIYALLGMCYCEVFIANLVSKKMLLKIYIDFNCVSLLW